MTQNNANQLKHNSRSYQPTYTQQVVRLVLYFSDSPGNKPHANCDEGQGNANYICCNEAGTPIISDVLLFE